MAIIRRTTAPTWKPNDPVNTPFGPGTVDAIVAFPKTHVFVHSLDGNARWLCSPRELTPRAPIQHIIRRKT